LLNMQNHDDIRLKVILINTHIAYISALLNLTAIWTMIEQSPSYLCHSKGRHAHVWPVTPNHHLIPDPTGQRP
jgi:hypothetical protein